jgi:mannosyltransferase
LGDVAVRPGVEVRVEPPDEARATPDVEARPSVRWWAWLPPAVVVLLAELHWLTARSLWQDELATLSAARRPIPELVSLLKHTDAVLGPYYLLLHGWTSVVGTSPAMLRLPSALAMAAAVALTAHVAARVLGNAAGLASGAVLAACPAVLLYGTEARAYALTAFFAAASTWLLVRALTSPGRGPWVGYTAALALLGWTQVTALTLVPAHLLVVATLPWTWPQGPARSRRAVWSGGAAVVAGLPVLLAGHLQSHQVAWIPSPTPAGIAELPALASGARAMGWIVVAVGLLAFVVSLRDSRGRITAQPSAQLPEHSPVPVPFGAALGASIAVVPVLLIAVMSIVTPLTIARYVLFTLVGWALLAGGASTALARRRGRVGLLLPVLLVATCVGVGADDRNAVGAPARRLQPDFRQLAAQLRIHELPGDAIVVPTESGRRYRLGLQTYLGDAAWPRDVLVVQDALGADRLDARECSPATCLGRPTRLWVGCIGACRDPLGSLSEPTRALIRADGYQVVSSWRGGSGVLSLLRLPGGG